MLRKMYLIILAIGALSVGCMGDQPNDSTPMAPQIEIQEKGALEEATPDCEVPELPPADQFVSRITNRYFPLTPGKVFRYRGETDEGVETIVTAVTRDTKTILGVETTVVHDRAYLDGELIEETFDWYAQDEDGNVWYFGEFATFFEDGQPAGHEGSWEAGVDGAKPGIVMLGKPHTGVTYAQEDFEGVAEDMAKIVDRNETIRVRYGKFKNVLVIREWTPLEPGVSEYKFYARGVGLILEAERRSGRGERIELVSIRGSSGDDEDDDDDISQGRTE